MATKRSTTTGRLMAPRSTSTSPPNRTSRTFTFTSDQIRSIKARPGIADKKIITQPPPPPPPWVIEVVLKPVKLKSK